MKRAKTFIALILCFILTAACSVCAFAAGSPAVTISNVSANPGESVTVDVKISNNPGIMAMAFCITYDSGIFEYTGYTRGYPSSCTVKDHPDKGHIAVVSDDSSDKATDGTIISLSFKIRDNAAAGKFAVAMANINRNKYGYKLNNSFSNSNQQFVVPTVTNGSITVNETCENSGHKYGEWQVVTPADCTHTGLKEHKCVRCEHTETAEIPITHDFEDDWTVDKAATPEEDGIMSRHCKKCDAVTDKITFTYKEVEDSTSSGDNSSQITDSSSSEAQTSSSGTTTSDSVSSGNSSSNKTPINNTVGAKNPLSAVESIKDYKENIKPNTTESDTSADSQSSNDNSKSNTTSDISTTQDSDKTELTDGTAAEGDHSDQSTASPIKTTILIISAILSAAIIAIGVILIIKRKKAE